MSEYLDELEQKHRQSTSLTYPMKWYKFLIYFSLFAGALLNFSTGVQYLSGQIYLTQGLSESDIQYFYIRYPAHKTLDLIYGLVGCGFAAFAFFTRSQLAKYHRIGPMCVYIYAGVAAFCSSMYTILSCILAYADVMQFLPQILAQIIVSAIYIWLNYVYFRKRSALFTNG